MLVRSVGVGLRGRWVGTARRRRGRSASGPPGCLLGCQNVQRSSFGRIGGVRIWALGEGVGWALGESVGWGYLDDGEVDRAEIFETIYGGPEAATA